MADERDEQGKKVEQEPRPQIRRGYVFRSVFGDNPELCGELVSTCLEIEVADVRLVEHERVVEATEDRRAGRLDLYVVDADGNRYDVEVQARSKGDELLRARHYQALMDVEFLKRGGKVAELPRSVVIFICDFDPFGDKLRRYDCVTMVRQTKHEVEDRRGTVVLNAKGKKGKVSPSLAAFLRCFAGQEVQGDPFVDKINAIIDSLLLSESWKEQYMTLEEEMEIERQYARELGHEEGLEEGRKKGLEQGLEQGRLTAFAELVQAGVLSMGEAVSRAHVTEARMQEAVSQR